MTNRLWFLLLVLLPASLAGQVADSPDSVIRRGKAKLANNPNAALRTLVDKAQETVSLSDFITDGSTVTTLGSINISTSPNLVVVISPGSFSVGQTIVIDDAAGTDTPLITTIKDIKGNNFTLDDAASTTVTGQMVYHGETYRLPISEELQLASQHGASLVIPPGVFLVNNDVTVTVPVTFSHNAKIHVDAETLTFTETITAGNYQHIFECEPSARITLKQPHSVCWYGAKPNGTGNSARAIQQAIWCAIQADDEGYQQGPGGKVYIPLGYYDCLTPIIYFGASGLGLTIFGEPDTGQWSGGTNNSTLRWIGIDPVFLTLSGANCTCVRDVCIISEAGTNAEKILWIDAKNGDPGADPVKDRPSTGVELRNVRISIGGVGGDCTDTCDLIAVAHDIIPGGSSSQIDTLTFNSVYLLGRGGNDNQDGGGIGIHWYGGGNAKVANLEKITTNGLNVGIKGVFSGHFVIKDWGGGGNGGYDMEQDGSGSVIIIGMNSEYSHGLVKQTAGGNACNCSLDAVEWHGFSPDIIAGSMPPRHHGVIQVRGYVELSGVTLRCDGAAIDEDDSTPWIELMNPAHELDPTTHAAYLDSTSVHLRGVTFNKAYSDGTFLYPPIIDGSGNWLYQANGYLTEKRQRIWVQGCASLEYWEGTYHGAGMRGEPQALLPKPNGPAHIIEYLKSDLSYSRINHNSLVTTMGGARLFDGLGRTYRYDINSTAADDNDFVETGPNGNGRFLRVLSASERIGNGTVSTPVFHLAGASTNYYHTRISPTSSPAENHRVLQLELPVNKYGYGLYQVGASSSAFYAEQFNQHATGNTQSHIRSVQGDSSLRLSTDGTKDNWTMGIDNSDSSAFKLDQHYGVGAATALRIAPTTYAATHYGPLNFSGVGHVGLKLNRLTGAQYAATAAENGDLYYKTDNNRLSTYLDGVSYDLVDTKGGQTLGGSLTLNGPLNMLDGRNIAVYGSTGMQIGTSSSQKIGKWGVTPVVQPASASQAEVTLENTNGEIGGLKISAGYVQSEIQALRDKNEELADDVRKLEVLVEALRAALVTTGEIKGRP